MRCNVTTGAVGKAKALGVGGMMNGTFVGNQMPLIWLSKNLQTYWSAQGNTWNGSSCRHHAGALLGRLLNERSAPER